MSLRNKLTAVLDAISSSERHSAAELRETTLLFRQITEHIREAFFVVDPKMTHMFYVSPGYQEIWGRSCESLYSIPTSFAEGIHDDDRERALQTVAPEGTLVPSEAEYRVVRPDDSVRWVRVRCFPIRDETGTIVRYAGIAEDITESKNAFNLVNRQAQALDQSNRRLSLLGEMTSLLQTVARVEEVAAVVGGYLEQLHLGTGGALYLFKESRNYLDLLARWGDLTLADRVSPDECWALRRGQLYRPPGKQPELLCRHAKPGNGAAVYLCLPMIVESGPLGLLHVVFSDDPNATLEDDVLFAQRMSEQLGLVLMNLRLRETLRLEAMQDPLTGLYNRRFLEVALKREFARSAREGNSVAVMMIDVDHFKRFNDTYGHNAGDAVLRQFGQLLTDHCRAAELACRFGGEEFTLVLPGAIREATAAVAERLLGGVRQMKVITNGMVLPGLTVSIGIALFPEHGETTTDVIHAADQALYAAKGAGRDRCVISTKR